jgi:hypothetical protein
LKLGQLFFNRKLIFFRHRGRFRFEVESGMKKLSGWLAVLMTTAASGLGNQFLSEFSCGDQPVDPCGAKTLAGRNLSEICPDLKLDLDQTSPDFGLTVYYQVQRVFYKNFYFILLYLGQYIDNN